ncbi:hypothetical protein BKA70DRAFT_752389 [Coprinopsis sp. MPI-PUGE-AT-0042]|nr:hypothetical protein BKA70DRAFT_752389 [Coprinopsis sp. MPI-PUGE-AT-0042]
MSILAIPLLVLTTLSLLASTASCVLGVFLIQSVSQTLWAIPGAFGLTAFYHALILLLRRLAVSNTECIEPPHWTRRFAVFAMGGASALAAIWTGVFVLTLYLSVLLFNGQLDSVMAANDQKKIRILLIETCVLSFVEMVFMGATTYWSRKEWKKAKYPSKWQWTAHVSSGSKWSINASATSSTIRQSVVAAA